MRTSVLSIENALSWSWGITIQALRRFLPEYEVIRILRGQFQCQNPRCGAFAHYPVDEELIKHFDVILPQNHDGTRYIKHRRKVCARIGGLDMTNPAFDPTKYHRDFEQVGAVIATNQMLYDIAAPVCPHTTLIPNGVDLEAFKSLEARPDRPFTIGFAGNTWGQGADYKGWKFFVQASVDLRQEGVEQLFLIHNHNQIAHAEMPEGFYHKIDALILPSRGEGCSNVVTEALACGVVCVLTKVGYHGEMLTDGLNCLFIDRDTEQIKTAIRRLIAEPDLRDRLAINGRAFAEDHHDVRMIAAEYDKVFKGILERNGHGSRSDGQTD
jgi:glycosyltransferase involved in cell wall biosynthesis